MGRPKPRSAIRRLLQPALPFRLLSLLPGVDLRIVADRTQRTGGANATTMAMEANTAPLNANAAAAVAKEEP